MSPRYRRLLIPGLLVALLVIVLVSSLAQRAEGAAPDPIVVSRITDPRVTESSGLVLSRAHDDLAYTMNDSNNTPYVFAIEVSSGAVVGATRIDGGGLHDTEALAIDRDGTLWVADTGDNSRTRSDAALYALPEPGPGDRAVTARRYPITYDTGPEDVEALVIDPQSGAKFLVSKGLFGGEVFSLPSSLTPGEPAAATAMNVDVPALITDGTFAIDGSYAVLRNYENLYVVDPSSWAVRRTVALPTQPQGESIAMERSGRSLLIGSEGAGSALLRLPFDTPPVAAPTPSASPMPTPPTAGLARSRADDGFAGYTWVLAGAAVVALVAFGAFLNRRR